ncbi:hypothetical protein [Actinoplanes sp. L3-i22]|uniref:hypothetical protein n=1 Tax=Actinoplanes sp. L3-i22 TaxID=2836373 RepID=UPI001C78115E|nr:hypothetical protein [Actinoplanes sp. L3-i22]BCY09110.1 hypothetical protein L3i22_041980 [Actinoplanes sp. L3-i22]
MDVGGLIGSILANPVGITERVLDETYGRLAESNAFGDVTDLAPEEIVATALGSWLARKFVGDQPEAGPSAAEQVTADRDRMLAAALGACLCWGRDPGCPVCAGAGTPGWAVPHRELFDLFVDPAVNARARAAGAGAEPEE